MPTGPKPQNIALIGFMGVGKSTVGRLVAHRLGHEFVDVDEMIEKRARRKITEIFETDGEEAFRKLEREVLNELKSGTKKVISTGGGLVAYGDNLERLKKFAVVVCLWATPEIIWQRVKNQKHRPLLNGEDPKRTIRELLAKRGPFYKQADILINTDRRTTRQVAQQLIHQYELGAK